jgi:prevent-host-death family protein
MKTASVAELKARLSEFIAAARRGEDVVVTDRGKPVARLTGLVGAEYLTERLERAIRDGVIRPPAAPLPADFLSRERPQDPDGRSLQLLLEEREESA